MSASMTRQHFQAIAETLNWEYTHAEDDNAAAVVWRVAVALTVNFKYFNPNFDHTRFMAAVEKGYTSE